MAAERFESFLVARIGRADRLLELSAVREIIPAMELERPVGFGGSCRGVANLRGEVIPVFDVALRDEDPKVSQLIIVAHGYGDASIGILVDDVLDIVQLPAQQVVSHPAGRGHLARTALLNGATLSVLTVAEVLNAA